MWGCRGYGDRGLKRIGNVMTIHLTLGGSKDPAHKDPLCKSEGFRDCRSLITP